MNEQALKANVRVAAGLLSALAAAFFVLNRFQPQALPLFVSLLSITSLAASLTPLLVRPLRRATQRNGQGSETIWTSTLFLLSILSLFAAVFIALGYYGWKTIRPNSVIALLGSSTFALMNALFLAAFVFLPLVANRLQHRERAQTAARNSDRLQIASLERSLALSELKTMQAQIEPHFLYNVLANVQAMVAHAPDAAQSMLEHLINYLKLALPNMRAADSALSVELDLARAYLGIAALRFGDRLQVHIDDKTVTEGLVLPPMLLLPLVENAVKHGVEPKPGRVQVTVFAYCEGDSLFITVADNGAGFASDVGTGVGLSNVRERLHAMYQARAELIVEPQMINGENGGVTATLRLPKMFATVNAATPKSPT